MKRSSLLALVIAIIWVLMVFQFTSCGGGGGGGNDNAPPSSGTGAEGVMIFWKHYGAGFGGGASVQETSDGGFIAAGTQTYGSSPSDIYMLKTDAQGAVQWERMFGSSDPDMGNSVQQTTDGGYIIGGCTNCGFGAQSPRFYLRKLDTSGTMVWDKTISGSSLMGAYAVREAKSGATPDGYVLTGSDVNQRAALIRTGPTGTVLWQKSLSCNMGWDAGFSVEQTADDGFVLAGTSGGKICLIKTTPSGTEQWNKNFGPGEGWSVKQAADGGYVLAGRTTPSPWFGGTARGDAIAVMTDKDGNQVWRKTFGGAEDDEARSVALTLDGGYILVGKTLSFGPGPVDHNQPWQWEDVFLIKLDANGNTVWQKVKGHRPNSSDGGASVAAVSDGGYVVTGNSNAYPSGTLLLMKTDKNGDTVNLGTEDLTITVPGTTGLINFTNAIDVASAGVRAFTLPHDVGATVLTVLIDVASGKPVSDFCDSGSYSAMLTPPASVTAGSVLDVTFTDCVNGPSSDQRTLNGSFTLKVETLSGLLSSSTYTVDTTVSPVNITSVQSGGTGTLTNTITGGTRFGRQSISGAYTELSRSITAQSAETLTYSETDGGITITRVVGPFIIHDSAAASGAGAYSFGLAGEMATVDPNSTSGVLTVTVLQPVQGTGPGVAPANGSIRITAQDSSRMNMTMTGSGIMLAIDTNADDTDDGTISTAWDFLY
jgi:hypothetical protein